MEAFRTPWEAQSGILRKPWCTTLACKQGARFRRSSARGRRSGSGGETRGGRGRTVIAVLLTRVAELEWVGPPQPLGLKAQRRERSARAADVAAGARRGGGLVHRLPAALPGGARVPQLLAHLSVLPFVLLPSAGQRELPGVPGGGLPGAAG